MPDAKKPDDAKIRNEYQEKAKAALEKVKTQLDELRVQADLAQAEVRDKFEEAIEALKKRQSEAKVRLDEAQSTGADAWKNAAKQVESVVDDLGEAVGKLAAEVQTALGTAGSAAAKARDAFVDEWKKARTEREKLLSDG